MHIPITLAFIVLQCSLCLNIRVPVDWADNSEVNDNSEQFNTVKNEDDVSKPAPVQYFQYTAKKPLFIANIAANNGANTPENIYHQEPIRPVSGLPRPQLGQHHLREPQKSQHNSPESVNQVEGDVNYVKPASTSFEIYHPYRSEEPALQQLYKDPTLAKIRNDLQDANKNLQKYQNEATDVKKDQYFETPDEIDNKKLPHKNIPAQFEVHKEQKRPVYYKYPPKIHAENIVSQKLRHPWNQNIAKVTPIHYRPIKNHLHELQQKQAFKYGDDQNEYPQLLPQKDEEDRPEGYDIYQKGKEKYDQIRDHFNGNFNKVIHANKHKDSRQLEAPNRLRNEDDASSDISEEDEDFVPIKNYAQVRKTETTKHLPREAALEDAENFEEIQNAPRLREAIKSKKAQTVYSEEGYEDTAYDHGGEQKHASDHENHGGYLKQNEVSRGKYKIPSFITNHETKEGSEHRDQIDHGKKWKNDIKENEDENESDYYESQEGNFETSGTARERTNDESARNKRNIVINEKTDFDNKFENKSNLNNQKHVSLSNISSDAGLQKYSNEKLHLKKNLHKEEKLLNDLSKENKFKSNREKYPYYFQNLNILSKNSPIRYAENFDLIPKKSLGGTEFYDSRSNLKCSDVEDNIDPIPEKLKNGGHPDDNENSEMLNEEEKKEAKFDTLKTKQRLNGLGDKIDCFKNKYFGENPLDSPFFNEDIIENPEPVTMPNLEVFNSENTSKGDLTHRSNLFDILDKLRNNRSLAQSYSSPLNKISSPTYLNISDISEHTQNKDLSNKTSTKSEIQSSISLRKKRAAPFTYEPYKIIRDSQVPDSKKTTTTSNISPLIKQLQSSRVIDKVNTNQEKDQSTKKLNSRVYKDIGKDDRQENLNDHSNETTIPSFVDVSPNYRRGEPRFEIRTTNYKSLKDEKGEKNSAEKKPQTTKNMEEKNGRNIDSTTQTQLKRSKRRKTTSSPYFDVSQYLPQTLDMQHIAASNTIRKIIRTTTPETKLTRSQRVKPNKNKEYDEYNEYNEDDEEGDVLTTSTSTTIKPTLRKRTRSTTTIRPIEIEEEPEEPKVRQASFPEYKTTEKIHFAATEKPSEKINESDENSPKYSEKKKKSSKSTLVTDTKSYGEGDDVDMKKEEEVDALIGVQQDMEEYLPLYERVVNKINQMKKEDINKRKQHTYDGDANIYGDDKFHFSDDEDENDDDEEDEEEDEDEDEDDDKDDDTDNDEDDEEDEVIIKEDKKNEDGQKNRLEVTTSEPTKRTLAKTTEAPAATTETHSAQAELKPIILKKKIEIHKETPVDKSSQNVSEFKQDIKEIEIIKELPLKTKKKLNKHVEALDLYRDDKLAEEINKLGDIEVFKENLDLQSGPKHGGNYRSITPEELQKEMALSKNPDVNKGDVEASQTETRKVVEIEDEPHIRRGSYENRRSPQRSAKFIELRDAYDNKPGPLHGGNLKIPQSQVRNQRRNHKSEKYVDIDEEEEDEPSSMHGGNFQSYGDSQNTGRQMHGGNYRSAKLVKLDDKEKQPRSNDKTKSVRNSPSSARTTTTTNVPYILDPSKRKYYYVDA